MMVTFINGIISVTGASIMKFQKLKKRSFGKCGKLDLP